MADYHVIAKVQQGRLKKAMSDVGIKSARQLALVINTAPIHIGNLLNFKTDPYHKRTGKLKKVCQEICSALGVDGEYLFPKHLSSVKSKNVFERYYDQVGLIEARVSSPEVEYEEKEAYGEAFNLCFSDIDDRERLVIERRFIDGKTLDDVGKELGLSQQRARQIEQKAIYKIKSKHGERIEFLIGKN